MKHNLKRKSKSKDKREKEKKPLRQVKAEDDLQKPYSIQREDDRLSLKDFERRLEAETRAEAKKEGKDPEFAVKLKKIDRLHRAVRGMQTRIETLLMDSGLDQKAARAEIKRLKERDGFDETQMALLNWAQVSVNLRPSLSEEEKVALLPGTYLRMKREHEGRVKELSDLLESLTPEQREFILKRDRKRMLSKERRRRRGHAQI